MTLAPDGLPPLREVIARHGLSAKKSLGQNFLLDLNLTSRIARASGPLEGARVVEIGPGPGGLTRALLAGGAEVVAIERDARCLEALAEVSAHHPGRLRVIEGDALEIDPAALFGAGGPAPRICANLPYNIGTELLVRWLTPPEWPPWWESLTLMFQREVAERIVAPAGSKAYGRLSILAQWRAEARLMFSVNPSAFTPPPKVTSAVVRVVPRLAPAETDPAVLERVVAAAFGQRRKMLRQALKGLVPEPGALLEAAGIAETRRAETLSIPEFLALAEAYRPAPGGGEAG
ncbi:16S rRNA (adenine(1518)-N(6)/adenine(1519)-N(6)) -dimethyltransferase RsmA [Paralimibaculum aggregatum]|uniref:Ribosomal RNA small subunit methyltransferase A n=1 Tax=Paralimibaculum aggregatum TaxID=3036245 RepID=A0ABQ6LG62_9RHOB|nr:16S rRNA (adenine(1518)-N(6)/adenine(1519)-N(6))-dimethyltransferase RsmA [Limibaculum sp. NKW23]GMG82305.1 16S rRNA (adenine(1518)-N(6)/adenine(1519)-N(6)) -dimethyltransferase RsmA [Limibaculum sp. NKW23]